MKALQIILAVFLLLLAAFCAFGFMASFEPGIDPLWKIAYLTIGIAAIAGAIWLFLRLLVKNNPM